MRHENVVVADDSMTVYFGDEDNFTGYIYKFIADAKADLSSGLLFVLRQSGSTGTWVPLPNTTQDDRNNTLTIASDSGATGYNRVEDVDIGPDGKIYFASTTIGRVYRFEDLGDSVNQFEIFVDSGYYNITHAGGVRSTRFSGCDNLAFDGEGNLWITQDADEKHVWVVRPSHTAAVPNLGVFMNTPLSCEPTGITFSPDYRFIFPASERGHLPRDVRRDRRYCLF
jgi:secreted PhoX family phosphatase